MTPEEKSTLCGMINRLCITGMEIPSGDRFRISEWTALSAYRMVHLLPDSAPAPKIAPDEDECMVMGWDGDDTLILVIEDGLLHMVEHAGTADAIYHDGIAFDREDIPPVIAKAIEKRD